METKDELGIQNWQDLLWRSMNAIQSTNTAIDSLYDSINEQMAKLNDVKPIYFKNPEKLNGKCHIRGEAYEITFIGRDLSVNEDNWTWILSETNRAWAEHKLTIMKYPKLDGYATMVKVGYGQATTEEINRRDLDDIQFMMNQFVSLTDIPF